MTTRKTAIIILIGAAVIWVTALLAFGILRFWLSPLGLIVMAIWFSPLILAGLSSLKILAWTFILMGVFFLFVFPLAFSGIADVIPPNIVYLILICVGINFTSGLLSAIISFSKEKKALTTEKKKKP